MRTYTIDNASYNGSSPAPTPPLVADPLVWVHGTVDGQSAGYLPVFWSAIQRAYAFGGTAGVQALLAPILLGIITGPPYPAAPALPNVQVNIPAPVTGGASSVNCVQALVLAWQA